MRLLTTAALLLLVAPGAAAADDDEEKVRQAAKGYLKALRSKDVDVVMKTVDLPFLYDWKREPTALPVELRKSFERFLKTIKTEQLPTGTGRLVDMQGVRKLFEQKTKQKAEDVVGEKGFAVFLEREGQELGAVRIRFKDGKAVVVGMPR
jgi:hypothetical protein